MHESIVFCAACTMSSQERLLNRTSNRRPYFVVVKYGGLASLYRKFTFAISSL